jgi:nitronate monooxygenase
MTLQQLAGVALPVIQAPMAGAQASAMAIAPLRAKAESQGSGDFSPLWSGQNVTGCEEIPAAQLTRVAEAS